MLKLREKLTEEHQRSQAEPDITLEQIQARHQELRDDIVLLDPWVTGGVVDDGTGEAADDE